MAYAGGIYSVTCEESIAQDALDECIDKWKDIVAGTVASRGPLNCVLCDAFRKTTGLLQPVKCDGCPVKARTGKDGCAGSPYPAFLKYMEGCGEDKVWPDDLAGYPLVADDESRELAQAELDFLISLRSE